VHLPRFLTIIDRLHCFEIHGRTRFDTCDFSGNPRPMQKVIGLPRTSAASSQALRITIRGYRVS